VYPGTGIIYNIIGSLIYAAAAPVQHKVGNEKGGRQLLHVPPYVHQLPTCAGWIRAGAGSTCAGLDSAGLLLYGRGV
jgi:hypothetical protein